MTFGISVELLHGSFRADPDGLASTGLAEQGEWPPAPARLFSALVAADGTGDRCQVTDGSELEWFEKLPPPMIHASPVCWHQRLEPRFVVVHKGTAERSTAQEYVGRKAGLVRPGVRAVPRNPTVLYTWEVEPRQAVVRALRLRAARVGYLGAADSPVRLRVLGGVPSAVADLGRFVPDPAGDVVTRVPKEGDLRLLDRMFETWTLHGAGVGRAQFPALRHEVVYRSPLAVEDVDRGVVVAWLRLAHALPGRRLSAVTAAFKAAVLSSHHGEPPPVLHGHVGGGSGYDLARFLALPDVGFHWSKGRIHGLALWTPPGTDARVRARAKDAAFSVRRLIGPGIDVGVVPRDSTDRVLARAPKRWCATAVGWATAFPAIHERRGPLDLAKISLWCEHAGLPAPVAARFARAPFVTGGVDLAPIEVNRPGRPRLPYSHVELRFAEPVTGPVVIGAGRQRGFGLCVPVAVGTDEAS